jgi:anthranilate synthase component 2
MLLILDNYDSFTFNLVQYFGELGADVKVYRNDEVTLEEIKVLSPAKIVISPGPGTPDEAGLSMQMIQHFAETVPILGVCLGHQCMAQVFGGKIINAREVIHGKTSIIHHNAQGVFRNINRQFHATRYHSLVVEKQTLPDCFEITAWTEDRNKFDEIMGIRHKSLPLEGVQFHPESILTEHGHQLLKNFLDA